MSRKIIVCTSYYNTDHVFNLDYISQSNQFIILYIKNIIFSLPHYLLKMCCVTNVRHIFMQEKNVAAASFWLLHTGYIYPT